jgi:hypothetical protein
MRRDAAASGNASRMPSFSLLSARMLDRTQIFVVLTTQEAQRLPRLVRFSTAPR